jgi:DNA repair photolyase
MSLKIGITEAGDASFDYSWIDKIQDTNMTILITKNITDKFIETVLEYKNKVILHATCTGYGGTVLEKNVPDYKLQLDQVKKLISLGFPKEQIVIRVDPVIPTKKGFGNLMKVVSYIHKDVKRFRVSILDNYKHVQERFKKNNLPVLYNGEFQASSQDFENMNAVLGQLKKLYNVTFESCAEVYLTETERIGCVSQKDLSIFGLKLDTNELKRQRQGCLCVAGKTELLTHKRYGRCKKFGIDDSLGGFCGTKNSCKTCEHHEVYGCPNACLYCYWR